MLPRTSSLLLRSRTGLAALARPLASVAAPSATPAAPQPTLSIVKHPYSLVDGSPLDASKPENQKRFAVFEFSGTQYKVSADDTIIVDNLEADIGQVIELDRVLMIGSKAETILGRPLIPGAKVLASVEEKLKDEKVLIFKKRRRKNKSQRLRGFRRQIATLRIDDIIYTGDAK